MAENIIGLIINKGYIEYDTTFNQNRMRVEKCYDYCVVHGPIINSETEETEDNFVKVLFSVT